MKKGGGITLQTGTAKDREANELQEMLNMDKDKIGPGKLNVIDPSKWHNQPVSVTQAIKILKEQQLIGIDNFYHIKRFLERFSKKVLAFIATNDQEIVQMKNKVTRDLQHQERVSDDKIKQFRNYITEMNQSTEARNEATFELIKEKQLKMDQKLSQVEVTEVVLDYVNVEIRKTKREFEDSFTENAKSVKERFDQLILEELTDPEGLFGKSENVDEDVKNEDVQEKTGQEGEENQAEAASAVEGEAHVEGEQPPASANKVTKFKFKTLKEYMVAQFREIQAKMQEQQDKHETHVKKTQEKFSNVDRRVEVDLTDSLQEVKLTADDLGQRLYAVQMEQIKPMKDVSSKHDEALEKLRLQITDVEEMLNGNNDDDGKSSIKRVTPLGLNLEESMKEAKDEMKQYIDTLTQRMEESTKKKLADLENNMRRIGSYTGDKSPTGSGRGKLGSQARGGMQRGSRMGGAGRGRGQGDGGSSVGSNAGTGMRQNSNTRVSAQGGPQRRPGPGGQGKSPPLRQGSQGPQRQGSQGFSALRQNSQQRIEKRGDSDTPAGKEPENNTFTSTMNVPGGLSTVKSKKFDDIKEEKEEEPQKETVKETKTVTEPITPKGPEFNALSPRELVRNPTEKTLKQPESQLTNYYDQEIREESQTSSALNAQNKQRATKLNANSATPLSLEGQDQITSHTPSHLRDNREEILNYVEEVQKHKRTIADLTTKVGTQNVQFNQYKDTVDKKFAQLENLIRKNEKIAATEVINAFNTGKSFASKASSQSPRRNPRIADPVRGVRLSQMRLHSGDSKQSRGIPNIQQQRSGNVMFEIQGEQVQQAPTPSLTPNMQQSTFADQHNQNSKRRIVTDIVSHTDSKRNVLQNVQSLETLGNVPSETNLNTYASQSNILPTGPVEDPMANVSPSKRTAAALEGSPMFAPLEVKFKNMTKFKQSAKKNFSSRKYPTIDAKDMDGGRVQPPQLEDDNTVNGLRKN